MYRASSIALSTLAISACATAPAQVSAQFQPQVERHIAAIHARNLAEIEATITTGEDLLLILPSGKATQTRTDYMAFHRSLFSNERWAMTFQPVNFQTFGNYGQALYRVTFDSDGAGPVHPSPAFLSLGFRIENGEWRLVHDQNTAITSAQ